MARPFAGLAVAVAVMVASVLPSGAVGDPRAEQEEVRDKKAEVASDIDSLNATSEEVNEALDSLEAKVGAEEAKLAAARQAADEANKALEAARLAETRAQQAVADMQQQVNELAVNVFVSPPSGGFVETLRSDDISQAVIKRTFIDVRSERDFDVLDQLTKAQDELEQARAVAEDVAADAQEAVAEVDARVDEVTAARDQQAEVLAGVESRLDARLSEAAVLEELDAELSAQIRKEEEELARRLAEEAARRRAAAPTPAPASVPVPPPSNISLRTVRGITVASSIADDLDRMLGAASDDGIALGGYGYRDSQRQIELRRAHCGSSNYAIYEMPASQCSPPTARPGQSMHERGLAVDFTYQGRTIQSRGSPAFQWLAANAAAYGFYNLPSEPWHWSINGN